MWMCSINVCIYFNYYYYDYYYFFMRLTRRAEGHRYQSFGHYLNDILDNERNEKNTLLVSMVLLLILYL